MFKFSSTGTFKQTSAYLNRIANVAKVNKLDAIGKSGVDALAKATPVDRGLTANSWAYRTVSNKAGVSVEWYNTNVVDGSVIAILIQYGHATGTGGYVSGIDYINPATKPIFDKFAKEIQNQMR
jgi:hypothetical protein